MIQSKKPCFILVFTCNFIVLSHSQKAVNPFVAFKNAAWLKDADIAVAKNTEIYTFGVENTEGVSRVSATLNVDEWLFPAKQNQTFYNRIFVNDEVSVEDVKVRINGVSKVPKSEVSVHDVKDEDIFYSDSKAADYSLSFNQMTEMNHTFVTKTRDVRYLSLVFLSSHYPVAEKEVIFEIPDWLDVDFKEYNFEGHKITKKIVANPKGGRRVIFIAQQIEGYKQEKKPPILSKFSRT